jgi:hypothetical protein
MSSKKKKKKKERHSKKKKIEKQTQKEDFKTFLALKTETKRF